MKESVAIAKEADAKKGVSPTKSDNSIHRVRNEPEMQLGSLRDVIGNIRHDGGTPSVDSIATELGGMHTAQRAPALLALQQTHGNRYVQRVIAGIQAKLVVGQPGDIYEQEADRVAEQVMRVSEPRLLREVEEEKKEEEETLQAKTLAGQITPIVQRQVEVEKEEETVASKVQEKLTMGAPGDVYEQEAEKVAEEVASFSNSGNLNTIQQALLSRAEVSNILGLVDGPAQEISRNETYGAGRLRIIRKDERSAQEEGTVSPLLERRILQSKGKGNPLPLLVQNTMEFQTGYDFSDVRVKTDSEAANLNRSLNARAFTLGSDIWLGQNESVNNVKLMAHELTHVVQQGAAKKISPKSLPGLDEIKSKSKVLSYLQAIAKGAHYDSTLYRKEINQFQTENSAEKIAALQRQILEPSKGVDIRQKSDSQTLRGCEPSRSASAVPTNFRQTAGRDAGGGILHFEYTWDSSTGNRADLSGCEVGEHVSYLGPSPFPRPSPPFPSGSVSNPTIIWIAGTDGAFNDNHRTGNMSFVKPYSASTYTATQYYRYRCNRGSPVNLMGPISIVRAVSRKSDGNYKFRITKSGEFAEIDPLPP